MQLQRLLTTFVTKTYNVGGDEMSSEGTEVATSNFNRMLNNYPNFVNYGSNDTPAHTS